MVGRCLPISRTTGWLSLPSHRVFFAKRFERFACRPHAPVLQIFLARTDSFPPIRLRRIIEPPLMCFGILHDPLGLSFDRSGDPHFGLLWALHELEPTQQSSTLVFASF